MIDMIDKCSTKKRSMVAVTMLPAETYTEKAKTERLEEMQAMWAQKNNFEEVYSGLNEKYINEIIDQESEK